MKTPTELIRILNKHLIRGKGKKLQSFSSKLFKELTEEERIEVNRLIEAREIDNYRGKFYTLDHKHQTVKGSDSLVTVMRDEYQQVHTIMCDGQILYTKEF